MREPVKSEYAISQRAYDNLWLVWRTHTLEAASPWQIVGVFGEQHEAVQLMKWMQR